MRTAAYLRKSTESEDRQVQSIEDQLKALKSFAQREGIRIDYTFTESKSAKAPYTRPEFQRLIDDVQSGKVTQIITWSMNRLSRNHVDGGLIAHLLQTGVLQSIRTPERTYLPDDSALVLAIENGMATSYIQDLRRNVIRGMDGKVSRGWMPGPAPVGYINNPVTLEIDPDPERFPLLRQAWDLMLTGQYTITEIHSKLMLLGLTTRNKRGARRSISRHTFYKMFSHPFYVGNFKWNGKLMPGKHQPLVTQQEFDLVQQLLNRTTERRTGKKEHAFSGVLQCGVCGCQVVGETRTKKYKGTGRTAVYTYYHCSTGRGGCNKRAWTEENVANKFKEVFDRIKLPPQLAEWMQEESFLQGQQELVDMADNASTLKEKLRKQTVRLSNLHKMRIDGEVSAEEYRVMKEDLETEKFALEHTIEGILSQEERVQALVAEKLKVAVEAASYSEMDINKKRAMAKSLGSVHTLTLENLDISLDPILEKIATIEPLVSSSRMPKQGQLLDPSCIWCTKVNAIRTSAKEMVT